MTESNNRMKNLHIKATKRFENIRGDVPEANLAAISQGAESRRKSGRYTLEEAAVFIEDNSRADAYSILLKLTDAIALGKLKTYRPNKDEVYLNTYLSRPWTDEAYWYDLNAWLEEKESVIGTVFPGPAKPVIAPRIETTRGLPKKKVITAFMGVYFKKEGSWKNALEDCPN